MSHILARLVVSLEETSGNSKYNHPIIKRNFERIVYLTSDSKGRLRFFNKHRIGLPLLDWLLDNDLFPRSFVESRIIKHILDYDDERRGARDDLERIVNNQKIKGE